MIHECIRNITNRYLSCFITVFLTTESDKSYSHSSFRHNVDTLFRCLNLFYSVITSCLTIYAKYNPCKFSETELCKFSESGTTLPIFKSRGRRLTHLHQHFLRRHGLLQEHPCKFGLSKEICLGRSDSYRPRQ